MGAEIGPTVVAGADGELDPAHAVAVAISNAATSVPFTVQTLPG
jgi:hypothetical protein